jgi:uncharacterized membrane protein
MTDLIVLGFANRELAEQAYRGSAELDEQGVLELNGAALAYRCDDGQVELVQPLRLAPVGAASGAITGGLVGLVLLAPLLLSALGAAAGAAGAGLSADVLNAMFVHELEEVLQPGRAAVFLVVRSVVDPSKAIDVLRPLSPRLLRTNWDETEQRRLIAALADDVRGDRDDRSTEPA